MFDGHADTQLIKNHEPDFQVNGTDLAPQVGERGIDSGDIRVGSRQHVESAIVFGVVTAILATSIIVAIAMDIKDESMTFQ